MKQAIRLITLTILIAFGVVQAYAADDPAIIFKEVIQLYEKGDLEGALEEARWGIERMEQMRQDKVSAVFPDEVDGYEGAQLSKNKAMGIMVTERRYTKDGNSVQVSLTEGSAGGGALSGLGALANMAGAMGGGRQVRIQRRKGSAMQDGSTATVNLGMQSGGNLSFTSNDLDVDALIAFAEAFPVAELDEARE